MLDYTKDQFKSVLGIANAVILYPILTLFVICASVFKNDFSENPRKSWLIRIFLYPPAGLLLLPLGAAGLLGTIVISSAITLAYALAAPAVYLYNKFEGSSSAVGKFLYYGAFVSLGLVALSGLALQLIDKIFKNISETHYSFLDEPRELQEALLPESNVDVYAGMPIRSFFAAILSPVAFALFVGGAAVSLAITPLLLIGAAFQGLSMLLTKPCQPSQESKDIKNDKSEARTTILDQILTTKFGDAIRRLGTARAPKVKEKITEAIDIILDCFDLLSDSSTETLTLLALSEAAIQKFIAASETGTTVTTNYLLMVRELLALQQLDTMSGININKLNNARKKHNVTMPTQAITSALNNRSASSNGSDAPGYPEATKGGANELLQPSASDELPPYTQTAPPPPHVPRNIR